MSGQNLNILPIPPAVIATVETNINAAIEAFAPYAVGLNAKQRKDLFKMGDKSTDIAAKIAGYLSTNPELTPSYVSKEEYDMDYTVVQQLVTLLAKAAQLRELLDDTHMAAGSDIMDVGMGYYHSARNAAKDGAPGAKAIYEDLKARFANNGRRGGTGGGSQ